MNILKQIERFDPIGTLGAKLEIDFTENGWAFVSFRIISWPQTRFMGYAFNWETSQIIKAKHSHISRSLLWDDLRDRIDSLDSVRKNVLAAKKKEAITLLRDIQNLEKTLELKQLRLSQIEKSLTPEQWDQVQFVLHSR